jgi:hypothetical protein
MSQMCHTPTFRHRRTRFWRSTPRVVGRQVAAPVSQISIGVPPQGRACAAADMHQMAVLDDGKNAANAVCSGATRRDNDYGLHDERIVPLRVIHCDTRKRRQLQHGRVLTFAQMRQQNDFSVGELKGVVMNV